MTCYQKKKIFSMAASMNCNELFIHLLALNQMVRKSAGTDLMVFVIRTLHKFVWVTVSPFI